MQPLRLAIELTGAQAAIDAAGMGDVLYEIGVVSTEPWMTDAETIGQATAAATRKPPVCLLRSGWYMDLNRHENGVQVGPTEDVLFNEIKTAGINPARNLVNCLDQTKKPDNEKRKMGLIEAECAAHGYRPIWYNNFERIASCMVDVLAAPELIALGRRLVSDDMIRARIGGPVASDPLPQVLDGLFGGHGGTPDFRRYRPWYEAFIWREYCKAVFRIQTAHVPWIVSNATNPTRDAFDENGWKLIDMTLFAGQMSHMGYYDPGEKFCAKAVGFVTAHDPPTRCALHLDIALPDDSIYARLFHLQGLGIVWADGSNPAALAASLARIPALGNVVRTVNYERTL